MWIGLISLPLYLWHWPLLSFAYIVEGEKPGRMIRIGAVLASVGLAWLTYWLVEIRVRNGGYLLAKSLVVCVLMFAVELAGFAAETFNGFKFRMGKRADYYDFLDNSLPELRYRNKMNLAERISVIAIFIICKRTMKDMPTWLPLPSINTALATLEIWLTKRPFLSGSTSTCSAFELRFDTELAFYLASAASCQFWLRTTGQQHRRSCAKLL